MEMYNNRAVEAVGVLNIQTCVLCYLKSKICLLQKQILQNDSRNTTAKRKSHLISMLFETEVPEIVCILNNERSKPPALAEKSFFSINKHGNFALFKIFSFKVKTSILETIFPHYTTKLLKIWAFWVICANKPYVYWLLIRPPLLICTLESDPDAG